MDHLVAGVAVAVETEGVFVELDPLQQKAKDFQI
jgi:hypothetical protein